MYRLTADPDTLMRLADGAFIPRAIDNPAYQEFLAWEAEGNEPEPAPSLPEAPVLSPLERLAQLGLSADDLRAILNNN